MFMLCREYVSRIACRKYKSYTVSLSRIGRRCLWSNERWKRDKVMQRGQEMWLSPRVLEQRQCRKTRGLQGGSEETQDSQQHVSTIIGFIKCPTYHHCKIFFFSSLITIKMVISKEYLGTLHHQRQAAPVPPKLHVSRLGGI